MSKNKLGLRRSGGSSTSRSPRVKGLGAGGLAPGPRVAPCTPNSPQEHGFDNNSPRLRGLE